MEAMAIGIRESVDDNHIRARVGQVEYLGEKIAAAGVPIVRPIGGHAVFLDAKAHPSPLAAGAIPGAGAGGGTLPGCRHPVDGAGHRLGRTRRQDRRRTTHPGSNWCGSRSRASVYTQAHMDVVAESVIEVAEHANMIEGLHFTYEPKQFALLPRTFRAHRLSVHWRKRFARFNSGGVNRP